MKKYDKILEIFLKKIKSLFYFIKFEKNNKKISQ